MKKLFFVKKSDNTVIKVELTEEQVSLMKRDQAGQFNHFIATDHEVEIYSNAIDKADDLLEKLDGYDEMEDEFNGDTIRWFLSKLGL